MSEPLRYTVKYGDEGYIIVESLGGDWVRHGDYARLKAKVERLTKAGDNLERVLTARSGSYEAGNASHEWQSAKNYKPTE
jgi:hypothetical protein